jgi:hypothetical protein
MVQAIILHHHLAHQCCIAPLLSNGESISEMVAMTIVLMYQSRFAKGAHMYMSIFLIRFSLAAVLTRRSATRKTAILYYASIL